MGELDIVLLVMAVGIWAIWYELRYGIEKRASWRRYTNKYKRERQQESRENWKKYADERQKKT